jgi:hypothetical protein
VIEKELAAESTRACAGLDFISLEALGIEQRDHADIMTALRLQFAFSASGSAYGVNSSGS